MLGFLLIPELFSLSFCVCPGFSFVQVGGISTSELNVLEREFLFLMNYELFVSSDSMGEALMELELELDTSSGTQCQAVARGSLHGFPCVVPFV